ncbi:bifunctional metallophosphatase/5'-nucleotidase [Phanerochaete sordida]|uniref:Bifunctional metallophosphatase/5'-nucleotidase n=1 Tax=Phanerochaete sordida TaxID=48140 RepID=A0A9P3G208_9APHY|nr:bifunctional metallophosphatase/5'-nucleotidase [Phanerochaete sordida]
MLTLPVLHFNDVYRVQPFKPSPSAEGTIDVTQWTAMLDDIRDSWAARPDGKREGLVLFSGDVFSPSTESSVTRGSHMVPVMNEIAPDVTVTGNHDFDFGYPHLTQLIRDTNFPWLLSNIVDTATGRVPEHLQEYAVFERLGVRIGVIGLVEKDWIATVSSWPPNFEYRDMAEVGVELSKCLRDPAGAHKCDLVLALTHARIPNDIALARALGAHAPAVQAERGTAGMHGVDLVMGGHDHLYYISRGVTSWEGYDVNHEVLGAEDDHGDVLVVKSGTDFRDLSEFTLELEDTPEGSVRRKVIKRIQGKFGLHYAYPQAVTDARHLLGKRHKTQPGSKSSERLAKLLEGVLQSVSKSLKAPVCKTEVELDCRSALVRLQESASGNWFADVLRHAYDDALCLKGYNGTDGVFICGGTIRGDSTYGPGVVTLGDILEILPFEDPIVVLEMDGETLWAALEAGLEKWPAQEGRFPVISGFRVSWDSRRPAGQRVLGVWLTQEPSGGSSAVTPFASGSSTPAGGAAPSAVGGLVDKEPVPRVRGGRKYCVVTREYMAQGHDGYDALKRGTYLVDDEGGQMMSAIVRKYLLGCRFVQRMSRLEAQDRIESLLHAATAEVIAREQHRQAHLAKAIAPRTAASRWRAAAARALRWSRGHYRDHLRVAEQEHMSPVDCFDGGSVRRRGHAEQAQESVDVSEEDLVTIHPVVDGRFKDEGRN